MNNATRAVLIVAHGSPARDVPEELRRERRRLRAKENKSEEERLREQQLEQELRHWPRNADNDPYQRGTEELARLLEQALGGVPVLAAYNEFSAPNVEEAVERLARQGITQIDVLSTMVTPGGGHSEHDIPEALRACRERFPALSLDYRWPYDLGAVAALLAQHLCAARSE